MKLAEALIERADLKTKIRMLNARLISNAKVQEGLKPNEDPKDLLKELDEKLNRMEHLIVCINKTNETTLNREGKTISSLIARRDVLTNKLSLISSFVDSGNALINRVSHSEIKTLATFNVVDMQKKIDKLSQEIRLLDTSIQELNWLTDLVE